MIKVLITKNEKKIILITEYSLLFYIFMKNKQIHKLPKGIVILGPTASGKTDWSLRLAHKHKGEIISADSRQIYKKMDIGTAKEIGDWQWHVSFNGLRRTYHVEGVPHHLLDFLDPGKRFSAAEFRDRAVKYMKMAHKHKRLPIVAGGTGLYISTLVDNFRIPRIPPNKKLRKSLEEKDLEELMELLHTLDEKTAKNIDKKNKRRIVRALEVCIMTGEPFSEQQKKGDPVFDFLQIGIKISKEKLDERINLRVDQMIENGLIEEIEGLLKQKYSWELPSMSGIGYRQFKDYFDGNISLEEAVEALKRDTRRFARRQMTWFKRDKRIQWVETFEEAQELVKKFLEDK